MKTERTPLFLIANLGSEVTKIFSAKEKGDLIMLDLAISKARFIISNLKKSPETRSNGEIDLLADVIEDLTQKKSKYQISPKNLKSYFLPFTMRLMDA